MRITSRLLAHDHDTARHVICKFGSAGATMKALGERLRCVFAHSTESVGADRQVYGVFRYRDDLLTATKYTKI
jgi:hypothetical protein